MLGTRQFPLFSELELSFSGSLWRRVRWLIFNLSNFTGGMLFSSYIS